MRSDRNFGQVSELANGIPQRQSVGSHLAGSLVVGGIEMAYFMLVMGKAGICKGASNYRNNAGRHEVTDMHRPLSGSGYNPEGRDERKRLVDVKLVSEQRSRQLQSFSRETR